MPSSSLACTAPSMPSGSTPSSSAPPRPDCTKPTSRQPAVHERCPVSADLASRRAVGLGLARKSDINPPNFGILLTIVWLHAPRADRLQLADQLLNSASDLVTDGPCVVDVLACRVVEDPVFIAFAWVEGPGVSTAHGDHDVK